MRGAGGENVGASASGAALSQMTFSQMPLPVTYKPGSRPWDGEPGCLVCASIMLKEEGRGDERFKITKRFHSIKASHLVSFTKFQPRIVHIMNPGCMEDT